MTTRDFSRRKLEIFPPSGSPPELNWISKYFPYWIKACSFSELQWAAEKLKAWTVRSETLAPGCAKCAHGVWVYVSIKKVILLFCLAFLPGQICNVCTSQAENWTEAQFIPRQYLKRSDLRPLATNQNIFPRLDLKICQLLQQNCFVG